eukprot:1906647-Heterocapsa_arctica.AAC.1
MVTRTTVAEQANLKVHYPSTTARVDIDLGLPVGKKRTFSVAFEQKKFPQIPVLFNPNAIKQHTRLLIESDIGLAKLMEAQKNDKLKAAARKIAELTGPTK